MLRAVTWWSIQNPGATCVLAAVLAGLSVRAATVLPLDAFPDVAPTLVQVQVEAPQRSAAELERSIVLPLERALASLVGLDELRTLTREGLVQATLVFEDGVSLEDARLRVSERLPEVALPPGVDPPTLGPRSTALGEVAHVLVTSRSLSLSDLRASYERSIAPRLSRVEGVAEVVVWGGTTPELRVTVDPQRAVALEVSLDDVITAVRASSAAAASGAMPMGAASGAVHAATTVTAPADVLPAPIRPADGIAVVDVATVTEVAAPRYGAATAAGLGEGLLVLVFADVTANPRSVAAATEREIASIAATVEGDLDVAVVYSRKTLVDRVIGTARRNLVEASALVAAVLLLFLGRLRASLLVAAAIPFALVFAVGGLSLAGIPGTLLSLGAVDFGLVVDSAVIITENVRRRLRGAPDADVAETVLSAVLEVRRPAIAGELVIACVYLPFLALGGAAGRLFAPMALTVLLALAGGAVFSLTVVPALVTRAVRRAGHDADRWEERVEPRLTRVLARVLARRGLILALALAVIGGGAWCGWRLPVAFVPSLREGAVVVNVVRPAPTSLDQSIASSLAIEASLLRAFADDIERVYTRTGTPEVATDPMGPEVSDVFIALSPAAAAMSVDALDGWLARLRLELSRVPGAVAAVSQPIALRTAEIGAGAAGDIVLQIRGAEGDAVAETARRLQEALARDPAIAGVRPQLVGRVPRVVVAPDRRAMGAVGATAAELAVAIDALDGVAAGSGWGGTRPLPIVVAVAGASADAQVVAGLPILGPTTGPLTIGALADVSLAWGPARIDRVDGARQQTLSLDWAAGSGSAAVDAVTRALAAPGVRSPGVWIEVSGTWQEIAETRRRLALVLPVTAALVLLIVRRVYGSWAAAARILVGVPFAVAGGLAALALRETPLSLPAIVGLVAVAGIGVLGDMVLFTRLAARGARDVHAVATATAERARPVLMTAIVTALGLVPMAFHDGVGAEVIRPLATAVVGGVVTSTLATLFVLPVLAVRRGTRGA